MTLYSPVGSLNPFLHQTGIVPYGLPLILSPLSELASFVAGICHLKSDKVDEGQESTTTTTTILPSRVDRIVQHVDSVLPSTWKPWYDLTLL